MSNPTAQMILRIKGQGLMPLFYHDDLDVCVSVIDALYTAGVRQVEFTNRGAMALSHFRSLVALKEARWPGLLAGIGTIKSADEATTFLEAGADFVVCPGMDPKVGSIVHQAGKLWIPGCMTATEVMLAEQHGAQMVKLFPGSLLGPAYLKGLREIFPKIDFMPTGGVELTETSIDAWLKAGAVVIGLGSKLISTEALLSGDYSGITTNTLAVVEILQKLRKNES
jgi:2-dehydro-3-deoxyphosphogluconate aldolase / (4S)-4-hydroxy-2-oxoglutarate aldolase